MRLDLYLFQKNYVKSRQKAKSLIEEGNVKLNGKTILKPAFDVDNSDEIFVEIIDSCPYVSRGGLKLEKIIEMTKVDIKNKVCLDIGASTGGFTHCLILNGAKKVYAVDSGTDQLAKLLKEDERVVSIENYNARDLNIQDIGEYVDVITIDVSFISQCLILPSACKLLKDDGIFLSLIKPQFEAGRPNIGKGGIVKDKKARLHAVNNVLECAGANMLICTSFSKSPIEGGDGNVEYLAAFSKFGKPINEDLIKKIVLE
ncbi:MAG: TlyA family RNA methyltransferase [Ruminococcaceae bacterium]|nr:TlyA family RNA methyltransferase [Oscillospiraceae bacterium]